MKKVLEFLKGLICLICFLGQLILTYQIGIIILKNQNLGMLILYYLACEFILHITGETSLTKIIISTFLQGKKND